MRCLFFKKKYYGIYGVVTLLLSSILLCETTTMPEENDVNTPSITHGNNFFSFVVNADSLSGSYTEEIGFNANTVIIDLYVENCKSGKGTIYLLNGSGEKLLEEYFPYDVKEEGVVRIMSPKRVKISLYEFSGNIIFRISKNS